MKCDFWGCRWGREEEVLEFAKWNNSPQTYPRVDTQHSKSHLESTSLEASIAQPHSQGTRATNSIYKNVNSPSSHLNILISSSMLCPIPSLSIFLSRQELSHLVTVGMHNSSSLPSSPRPHSTAELTWLFPPSLVPADSPSPNSELIAKLS